MALETSSISNFQKMVMEQTKTEELSNAALILNSRETNLVTLKKLCTRSIAVNMAKFSAFPERISHLLPQLKSDILNCAYKMNSAANSVVASSLPRGREVLIPLRVVQQLINPTLTEFDFALCPSNVPFFETNGVDFKLLQTLSSACKGISRIADRRSTKKHPPSLGSHIINLLSKFTNLQHLDMTTVKFSDDDIKDLSKSCPRLRSLTLASSSTLTAESLKSLSTLPSLESLVLGRVNREHNRQMRLSCMNAINIMPYLKSVRILEDALNAQSNDCIHFCYCEFRLEIPLNPECIYNLEELGHVDLTGPFEK